MNSFYKRLILFSLYAWADEEMVSLLIVIEYVFEIDGTVLCLSVSRTQV
jgi:hypothetical protein